MPNSARASAATPGPSPKILSRQRDRAPARDRRDPYDENELAYTFEKAKLKTVASMATVLQRVPLLKDCGYDYSKVVHGEQRLTLHRPLEPEGEIVVDSRVLSGKGAVINTELSSPSIPARPF